MKNRYYVFGFFFRNRGVEIGIFTLDRDLWEGDTNENVHQVTQLLCERNGWKYDKIKSLSFKEIDQDFIKGMANVEGSVLRLGNVGAESKGESGSRSGDGHVQGRGD